MSRIKNLFDGKGSGKILVNTNLNEAGKSVESADFAKAKVQQINRFLPNINYSTASNFVVYGSAEKYYDDSMKKKFHTILIFRFTGFYLFLNYIFKFINFRFSFFSPNRGIH